MRVVWAFLCLVGIVAGKNIRQWSAEDDVREKVQTLIKALLDEDFDVALQQMKRAEDDEGEETVLLPFGGGIQVQEGMSNQMGPMGAEPVPSSAGSEGNKNEPALEETEPEPSNTASEGNDNGLEDTTNGDIGYSAEEDGLGDSTEGDIGYSAEEGGLGDSTEGDIGNSAEEGGLIGVDALGNTVSTGGNGEITIGHDGSISINSGFELGKDTSLFQSTEPLNTTVYTGLGDPSKPFMALKVSNADLQTKLSMSDVEALAKMAGYVADQSIESSNQIFKVLERAQGAGVTSVEELLPILHNDIMVDIIGTTIIDFEAVFKQLSIGGIKGMLGGTIESPGVSPPEYGCNVTVKADLTNDLMCVVNRVFAFIDASQRAMWDYIEKLSKDDCYVFDCFMLYDYLEAVQYQHIDPTMALQAAYDNAECAKKNILRIANDFHPDAPLVSSPPYIMSLMVRYVAYVELLSNEAHWAADAIHALLMVAQEDLHPSVTLPLKRRLEVKNEDAYPSGAIQTRALMALHSSKMYTDYKLL